MNSWSSRRIHRIIVTSGVGSRLVFTALLRKLLQPAPGSPTLLYVKNKWLNDEWNSLSMILAGEVGNEGHHPVISTGVKNRNGMLSRDHVR
jgi:hypothetical protein